MRKQYEPPPLVEARVRDATIDGLADADGADSGRARRFPDGFRTPDDDDDEKRRNNHPSSHARTNTRTNQPTNRHAPSRPVATEKTHSAPKRAKGHAPVRSTGAIDEILSTHPGWEILFLPPLYCLHIQNLDLETTRRSSLYACTEGGRARRVISGSESLS